jgi:hypothetical protein
MTNQKAYSQDIIDAINQAKKILDVLALDLSKNRFSPDSVYDTSAVIGELSSVQFNVSKALSSLALEIVPDDIDEK